MKCLLLAILLFALVASSCDNKDHKPIPSAPTSSHSDSSDETNSHALSPNSIRFFTDYENPQNARLVIKRNGEFDNDVSIVTSTNMTTFLLSGDLIYYTAADDRSPSGNLRVCSINLNNATKTFLDIFVQSSFSVDPTGEWICYAFAAHPVVLESDGKRMVSYFPDIYLENLKTGKKIMFDKSTEVFRDSPDARIKWELGAFVVSFYTDSSTPVRVGVIDISTNSFVWRK